MKHAISVQRLCVAVVCLGWVASSPAAPGDAKANPAAKKDAKRPATAPAAGANALPRVELEIAQGKEAWGKIVLELNDKRAPVTVKNFLRYVDEGFYDGTIFHRVIGTFMIQGGGFISPTEKKSKGLHEPIKNESKDGLKNLRGTIAMARIGRRHDSATSQFFINVKDNPSLNHPGFDGAGYAVFGKVVAGMDVVDRIKNVETRRNPQNPREKSIPVNPPVIAKARRVGPKHRVLILCTGNASSSQMAEGLWRHLGGDRWEVFSAGIKPAGSIPPMAIKVMSEIGIDISKHKSKSVQPFVDQPFDLVVTVCANAEKTCPAFPKAKRKEHWPVDNPSQVVGSEDEKLKVFRHVRDQLEAAIQREIAKTDYPKLSSSARK